MALHQPRPWCLKSGLSSGSRKSRGFCPLPDAATEGAMAKDQPAPAIIQKEIRGVRREMNNEVPKTRQHLPPI